MHYTVKRGEQTFGPYTLGDLQKYVQTGNIQPTDFAQSEGMSDWAPVSQVIGTIAVPTTAYGAAVAPALQPVVLTVPLPPNLHWSVVLLIGCASWLITPLWLFNVAWLVMLANWARKLDGDNNTLIWAAMYPAAFLTIVIAALVAALTHAYLLSGLIMLASVFVCFITYYVSVFKIKAAMEEYYNSTENCGLRLNGAMTFFFSTVYLQYHVNDITKWKKDTVQSYS